MDIRKTGIGAIAALLIFGSGVGVASAKITPPVNECVNGGGNLPSGQQPDCTGNGLTEIDIPALNPSGHAPPGQN